MDKFEFETKYNHAVRDNSGVAVTIHNEAENISEVILIGIPYTSQKLKYYMTMYDGDMQLISAPFIKIVNVVSVTEFVREYVPHKASTSTFENPVTQSEESVIGDYKSNVKLFSTTSPTELEQDIKKFLEQMQIDSLSELVINSTDLSVVLDKNNRMVYTYIINYTETV